MDERSINEIETKKGIWRPLFITKYAIALLIIIGIFNTSPYGATLSWVLVPFSLTVIGTFLEKINLKMNRAMFFAFAFWVVCIVSTVLSPSVTLERDGLTSFLFVLWFSLIIGNYKTTSISDFFIVLYVAVSLLVSCIIIYNWVNGIYYNEWFARSTLSVGGVQKDPNYVAAFLAPAPILLLLYGKYSGKDNLFTKKWLAWCLVAIVCVSLLLNGSRGGILSALIAVCGFVFFSIKSTKKRIKTLIALIIIATIGVIVMINVLPEQTIERLFFQSSGDTRSKLWSAAIMPFTNNPLIGEGLNSASKYSLELAGNASHNMYIDILSGAGLLGAALYIMMIWDTGFRRKKHKIDIALACFALLMPQMFINGFNSTSQWIPIIMLWLTSSFVSQQDT